jgi:hypothetical protein
MKQRAFEGTRRETKTWPAKCVSAILHSEFHSTAKMHARLWCRKKISKLHRPKTLHEPLLRLILRRFLSRAE